MNNLPPFYVGQKVISVSAEFPTAAPKGSIHIIMSLAQLSCGCWVVDIGVKTEKTYVGCTPHGKNTYKMQTNGVRWIAAIMFAPVQENFQSITLEKVLEEETKLISVN